MSAIEKAIADRLLKSAENERPALAPAIETKSLAESVAQRALEQSGSNLKAVTVDLGENLAAVGDQSADSLQSIDAAAAQAKATGRQIILPHEKLALHGYISLDDPRSQIAEEYRSIKRPLLIRADQSLDKRIDNANVLMVTSSIQGEGKTFTAINLALSMAMERDKTVLFLDTDIATAAAGQVLGFPRETPGLVDVLTGKAGDVADVIVQTDIPNFRVIPAGKPDDHASELLASARMKRLVRDLSYKYPDRIVLFDAPPILQTNEARILATLAGQIVFVVAANSTSQSNVNEALSHLNKDVPVGLLLNRSFSAANDGYGYNYGSYAVSTG